MEVIRLAWVLWVLVGACASMGVGEGRSSCPCHLAPAYSHIHGGEDGNLMWNCRDRLLPEVPVACWEINANVTQVDLFNNHITVLRKGDFDDLQDLHYLNTFKGYLTTVEAGSLRELKHLEHLDLGFSSLEDVPEEVRYLPQLQVLALEYNSITEVPVDLIKPLVNLQWLILVRNQVRAMPELQFLPQLTWLNLESNNLSGLPLPLFGDLSSPCELWIDDNPLSDVAAATLLPLPDGSEIRTNASVAVWARDDEERMQLTEKEWRVYNMNQLDLDLEVMIHLCDEAEHPDPSHPCNL